MKDRSTELQSYHTDGQRDAENRDYDPPHKIGFFDVVLTSEDRLRELREDNEAYDAGWDNVKNR